ncbi:MAG: enoyl-CoA hydratase/isomerase family protein [Candidatus Rokubacteria bacterium]|nr:enoyl-CoA hydratase/isomerase family protein [Candidatus Rokubacteria bacterium]
MADELLIDVADGIATLTLNRPEKRNALSESLIRKLRGSFDDLEARRDVRVVVIRGAGPVFCAGMDLKEVEAHGGLSDPENSVVDAFQRVERSPLPSIAMVHGDAIAGGCELALHCDLRVVAESARFAMPLARIGHIVPFKLGQKLVEILGPAHTRLLLLTAKAIDGRRAYEIGMVTQAVPAADVEKATYELARTVAANAPMSLSGLKASIARAISLRESVRHDDIDELVARVRVSKDASEGRRAMLEKRPPVFRGE